MFDTDLRVDIQKALQSRYGPTVCEAPLPGREICEGCGGQITEPELFLDRGYQVCSFCLSCVMSGAIAPYDRLTNTQEIRDAVLAALPARYTPRQIEAADYTGRVLVSVACCPGDPQEAVLNELVHWLDAVQAKGIVPAGVKLDVAVVEPRPIS